MGTLDKVQQLVEKERVRRLMARISSEEVVVGIDEFGVYDLLFKFLDGETIRIEAGGASQPSLIVSRTIDLSLKENK